MCQPFSMVAVNTNSYSPSPAGLEVTFHVAVASGAWAKAAAPQRNATAIDVIIVLRYFLMVLFGVRD